MFYAWWRTDYVWVPYTLTLMAFAGTAWMESAASEAARKQRMAITVVLLLAPLLVIKYAHLVADSLLSLRGEGQDGDGLATLDLSSYGRGKRPQPSGQTRRARRASEGR